MGTNHQFKVGIVFFDDSKLCKANIFVGTFVYNFIKLDEVLKATKAISVIVS